MVTSSMTSRMTHRGVVSSRQRPGPSSTRPPGYANFTQHCIMTRPVCLGFPNVVAQRHIFGVRNQGVMTPNFDLSRDFCTMHLPRVSSSYVYSFGSYRVDKQTQTNRRRRKHQTFFATLRRWVISVYMVAQKWTVSR